MDSNFTNLTQEDRLKIWNSEIFTYLLYDILIHCLYLTFGIFGNTFVIFVYMTKIKKKDSNRYFIPVLAAIDLAACILGSTFAISLDSLYVIYPSEISCKMLWAACMFTTQCSVMVLLIISVQRYLLVCKPHGGQMTLYWKRIALILAFILAAILTFPVTIFYGEKHVTNKVLNVTGVLCYIKDEYTNSRLLLVYNLTLLLMAVVGTASFTSLYLFVGRAIYKKEMQKKSKKRFQNAAVSNVSVTEISASVDLMIKDGRNNTLNYQSTFYLPTPKHGKDNPYDINDPEIIESTVRDTTLPIRHKLEIKQRMRQRKDARRFTWLFMTISVVFAIVFTPRLILILVESLDTEFWETVSNLHRLIYSIFYRAYILYHISNPVIYGFQDKDFKRHFKAIFCACKNRINPR